MQIEIVTQTPIFRVWGYKHTNQTYKYSKSGCQVFKFKKTTIINDAEADDEDYEINV